MVIKEWKCPAHGFFEGAEPVCPKGCTAGIMRVFLTAPAIRTPVMDRVDNATQRLADRFGMSDLRGHVYEGEAQKQAPVGDFAPRWTKFDQSSIGGLKRSDAVHVPGTMPHPLGSTHMGYRVEGGEH